MADTSVTVRVTPVNVKADIQHLVDDCYAALKVCLDRFISGKHADGRWILEWHHPDLLFKVRNTRSKSNSTDAYPMCEISWKNGAHEEEYVSLLSDSRDMMAIFLTSMFGSYILQAKFGDPGSRVSVSE